MGKRLRIVAGAGMAASIVVASGAVAEPVLDATTIDQDAVDVGDSVLVEFDLGGEPSPAGCVGKSNDPHKSATGGVKGVTQVDCLRPVGRLRTTAQLWRKRWWGYEKVGTKGDNTNFSSAHVKASGNYSTCQRNRWRTEGEHWSVEGGRTYYAHTMNYNDVTC